MMNSFLLWSSLLFENEIHGKYKENKTNEVVQTECFRLEQKNRKDGKNNERDDFLNDFELPEIKRTAVCRVADTVGGNLTTVLKKSNSPTNQNDHGQSKSGEPTHLAEFQMSVPRKCHENIRAHQQANRYKSCHKLRL